MDRFVTKSKRPGASPTKKQEDEEEGGLAWPSPPKLVGKKRKSNELAAREDENEQNASVQDEREVKKPKKAVVGMRRPAGKHQTSEVTLEKHDNYNQKLTAILAELGQIEKSKGQMHRARAYEKAVRALRNHPTAITSGTEAQKLDGIGKKIGLKIDEILATGKLKKLDTLNEDPKTKALNLFQQISGFGPVAAKKLIDDGVTTLEDLEKLKHTFTHHQRIGLKHFHEFNERIPRAEMEQLEKIIKETLSEVDEELIGTTCGSYRRGAESSGDIDVLLTHPKYTVATKKKPEAQYLSRVVEALKRKGLITDDISQGSSKYMGVCKLPDDEDEAKEKKEMKKQDSEGEEEEEEVEVEAKKKKRLHRRIDLRVIPYENYYCGLLYFTGSDFFNQQMRKIALDRGFTLNEYDVCPVGSTGVKGDPIEVHSEEDIFELLGMTYKSPEQRNL